MQTCNKWWNWCNNIKLKLINVRFQCCHQVRFPARTFLWSLHLLSVSAWVPTNALQLSKDKKPRVNWQFKCSVSRNVSVNSCQLCDRLVSQTPYPMAPGAVLDNEYISVCILHYVPMGLSISAPNRMVIHSAAVMISQSQPQMETSWKCLRKCQSQRDSSSGDHKCLRKILQLFLNNFVIYVQTNRLCSQ